MHQNAKMLGVRNVENLLQFVEFLAMDAISFHAKLPLHLTAIPNDRSCQRSWNNELPWLFSPCQQLSLVEMLLSRLLNLAFWLGAHNPGAHIETIAEVESPKISSGSPPSKGRWPRRPAGTQYGQPLDMSLHRRHSTLVLSTTMAYDRKDATLDKEDSTWSNPEAGRISRIKDKGETVGPSTSTHFSI